MYIAARCNAGVVVVRPHAAALSDALAPTWGSMELWIPVSRFGHTITDRVARDASVLWGVFCCAESSTLSMCLRWGRLCSVELGAYNSVPGRTAEGLQSHHIALQISITKGIAIADAIRPGSLVAFPPARQVLHARSSVVAGPCSANMLAACPIRCLLNASRADMHWLAVLAEPSCKAHSLACPLCEHLRAAGWSHEALTARS
jgi:hypothetical protein